MTYKYSDSVLVYFLFEKYFNEIIIINVSFD